RSRLATVAGATSDIFVTAKDTSEIESIAGALAVSVAVSQQIAAAPALGLSLTINEIVNQTRSAVEDSDLESYRNVSVTADAEPTIDSMALGLSVGVAISGNAAAIGVSATGAVSYNEINSRVEAALGNIQAPDPANPEASGTVLANGVVKVAATDTSKIDALGAAASASVSGSTSATGVSVSLGLGLAHNTIDKDIVARVVNVPVVQTQGGDVQVIAVDSSTIDAMTFAAAVSVAVGNTGVGVAGGASAATNIILTRTNAFIEGSQIGSVVDPVGNVTIDASSTSKVDAITAGLGIGIGAGLSSTGVGVGVGIAVARNFIGWDPYGEDVTGSIIDVNEIPRARLDKGMKVRVIEGALAGEIYEYIGESTSDSDPNTTGNQPFDLRTQQYRDGSAWKHVNAGARPAVIQAYSLDTVIHSRGLLTIESTSEQAIDSIVVSAAIGVGGGSTTGVGVSAAGTYAENKIRTDVKAYVDGDGDQVATDGISASSVRVDAIDSSSIDAIAGAASLAGGFASTAGVAVAVGLSLAFNEVDNQVDASIRNVDQGVTANSGDISIYAQSSGKRLFEFAPLGDLATSKLDDAAKEDSASSGSSDNGADVRGDNAILLALRQKFAVSQVDLATDDSVASPSVYVSNRSAPVNLKSGATVKIASGHPSGKGDVGRVYQYIGADSSNIDLRSIDYTSSNWVRLEKLKLTVVEEGNRWTLAAPDGDTYLLTLVGGKIVVSKNTINAVSAAASLSVGIASTAGVAVSGAGAYSQNVILSKVNAYGSASHLVSQGDVNIDAVSQSAISSLVAAASVAIGGASTVGVGVSIGISIAENLIGWQPSASTETPAQVRSYLLDSSVDADGQLSLNANSGQSIQSMVLAGSVGVGAAGTVGVSVAGSGAISENRIGVDVQSFIEGSRSAGIAADSIAITALDQSKIDALTGAAALSIAFGGKVGVAVSVGLSLATNYISSDVSAFIRDADDLVKSEVGNISLLAESKSLIQSISAAASLAAGFGGVVGVAVSGAGADSTNIILTTTEAYADGSVIDS
ncbi:MAG: hypothetical protein ACK56Q_02210, partial [Pirellulaceae bacterium]